MNQVNVQTNTKENIKLAKSLLANRLRVEEVALLERQPKNISDIDLKLLLPLSHYKHWLDMACEAAEEVVYFGSGLELDISPLMRQDLSTYVNNKARSMKISHQRSMQYYREYRKVMRDNGIAYGDPVVLPVTDDTAVSA